VAAFRATLEETVQADLLLHVVDGSSSEMEDQVAEVNRVLHEIGAGEVPQIVILNKADLTGLPAGIERDEYAKIARLRVSAKTGAGLDLIRQAVDESRSGTGSRDSSDRAVA
jgi:GTP-binding protein HflX